MFSEKEKKTREKGQNRLINNCNIITYDKTRFHHFFLSSQNVFPIA